MTIRYRIRGTTQILAAAIIVAASFASAPAADALADPSAFGYKHMGTGGLRPLLVILLEDPAMPKIGPSRQDYERMVFGPLAGQPASNPSVFGYFAENSNGNFIFGRADIIGPFAYKIDGEFKMRTDAITVAANQGGIQFSRFDRNHDGTVSQDELSILVICNRPVAQTNVHEANVQGLHVKIGVSGVGDGMEPGWAEHELTHTLGAKDLYGPWGSSAMFHVRVTMMGPTFAQNNRFHVDAWHKMQFGWLRPRVRDLNVAGSDTLVAQQIPQNETQLDKGPILLYDPARGTNEFFLLEFRNPSVASSSGNYDSDAASTGVAIWNVRQDGDMTPVEIPSEGDASRKLVTVFTRDRSGVQGGNQLINDPAGFYHLRWTDGTETGFGITAGVVSGGDPVLKVSWAPVPPPPPFGGPGPKHTLNDIVAREIGICSADGTLYALGYKRPDSSVPSPAVDRSRILTTREKQTGGYSIYKWNGSEYQELDGKALRIAVDKNGTPWVVNDQNTIFQRVDNSWRPLPGAATDIAAGGDGSIWVIGANADSGGIIGKMTAASREAGIHKWNGTGWDQIDGAAVSIAVDQEGNPWVVNGSGTIFRRQNNAWVVLPGVAKDIAIGGGKVYVVGTDPLAGGFGIYVWNESESKFIGVDLANGGGGTSVAVYPNGDVCATTKEGQINYTAPRIR